ncbi:hypothetical protein [Paracoccus sphaerophysae]|uniref:hypothetical protein n=1 Tax=Paracoccus sphaerophysae TaxID=690417 RepID=UPI0023539DA6|nr:hypothetical protein [Paracoccus sphaerophysae]
MIRLARLSGLDDRFMLFVVGTMALSVVVSSAGAAIASLMHGNAEAAGGALVMGLVGGTMVFGPMLLIGFLPSLIAFALVYRLAGGAAALTVSAEYAGVATAAAATVLWIVLMTRINGDGAEIVVGVVGIAAIMLAPSVARWAYRDRSGHGTKPAGAGIR